ncbi:hypothetical protein DMA11_15875 [Marinilabiliaceae bacterium JC017]|nr:hypothetical protein DMA11_15875 [Marinilabiliaceae bacterium JC017]
MNPIRINTNTQSADAMTATLYELVNTHFTHYEQIHERAKKDNKPVPIDLFFGTGENDSFTPLQWQVPEEQLVKEIIAVLPSKKQSLPGEYGQAEIAFFSRACEKAELKETIKTWLIRVATYNFGRYSKTMAYPDRTPVAFWAAFFFALHNPDEMEITINYLSSLNLINYDKKKYFDDDHLNGFTYTSTIATTHYLYNTLGWNENTIRLLCAQVPHYSWNVPDEFLSLIKETKPEEYLCNTEHMNTFVVMYKESHKAYSYDNTQTDIMQVIENIFPHMIDGDQLESIKDDLINTFISEQ